MGAGWNTCSPTSVRRWWTGGDDLGAPELTPELIATLVAGVREEFAGRDENDVLARRDRALRELLALKEQSGLD